MDLNDVLTNIMEDLKEFESEFLEELNDSIKAKTPVRSGALRDAFEVKGDTIVNDKEYFAPVEYGTANRSPVGMVRRSVIESQQIADKVARKVGRMK